MLSDTTVSSSLKIYEIKLRWGLAEMEANGRIGGEPVPAGGPVNDKNYLSKRWLLSEK